NRNDNEARAATPPNETAPLLVERSNETTSAGEESATVKWWVHSDPEGATVIIDGRRYEQITPMKGELPRSAEPLAGRFELAGYHPREVALAPVASQNLQPITLRAIEAEPVPTKPVGGGLRFTARKPKPGKPKAPTDGSTPSKPGPTEAT